MVWMQMWWQWKCYRDRHGDEHAKNLGWSRIGGRIGSDLTSGQNVLSGRVRKGLGEGYGYVESEYP